MLRILIMNISECLWNDTTNINLRHLGWKSSCFHYWVFTFHPVLHSVSFWMEKCFISQYYFVFILLIIFDFFLQLINLLILSLIIIELRSSNSLLDLSLSHVILLINLSKSSQRYILVEFSIELIPSIF